MSFGLKNSKNKRGVAGIFIDSIKITNEIEAMKESITEKNNRLFYSSIININQIGGIPKKDECKHIVTKKLINVMDFLYSILNEEGIIEECYLVVYRIGKNNIEQLEELIKIGKINKIVFVINDGLKKLIPEQYNRLKQLELDNLCVNIKEENTHAKILTIKTKKNFFVIEGSGNLNTNARIEQYNFLNSEPVYNFHKQWISKILKKRADNQIIQMPANGPKMLL